MATMYVGRRCGCARQKKRVDWNGLKQVAHICKGGYKKPK